MSELELKSALAQAIVTFCNAAILTARFAKLAPRKPRRFLMRRSPRFVVRLAVVMAVSFALWPEVRARGTGSALRTRGTETSPGARHSA